MEYFKLIYVL